MSKIPHERSESGSPRIGERSESGRYPEDPDQERNVHKFPTISHVPEKNIKTGTAQGVLYFILHPSYSILFIRAFRRKIRASDIVRFLRRSRDEGDQQDTLGVELGRGDHICVALGLRGSSSPTRRIR